MELGYATSSYSEPVAETLQNIGGSLDFGGSVAPWLPTFYRHVPSQQQMF